MATPDQLLWLKSIAGEMATTTLTRLDETLPWYAEMPPARRASIGLVAQAGISSFIEWSEDPSAQPWVAADVFSNAPRELLRSISLQETLQLIRVVVEVVESRVVVERPELMDSVLRYSRDIAFSAADVYARAAEARGLWDARLEALVVDSIVSRESSQELASRVSALGWKAQGPVAVLLGPVPETPDPEQIRKLARKANGDALVGVHGRRQVVVLGSQNSEVADADFFFELAKVVESEFAAGQLILGSLASSITEANRSVRSAFSASSAAPQVLSQTRIARADDLLPERALAGDPIARSILVGEVYGPLARRAPDLLATLRNYLDTGRSLETTARQLFVHANTVRYRLKRISELIGLDATDARSAFVLQVAMILGAINDVETGAKR